MAKIARQVGHRLQGSPRFAAPELIQRSQQHPLYPTQVYRNDALSRERQMLPDPHGVSSAR